MELLVLCQISRDFHSFLYGEGKQILEFFDRKYISLEIKLQLKLNWINIIVYTESYQERHILKDNSSRLVLQNC